MKLKLLTLIAFLLLMGGWAGAQQVTGSISAVDTSGVCTTANGYVLVHLLANAGSVGVDISGSYSGTLNFLVSVDGTNFRAVNGFPPNSSTGVSTTTGTGAWTVSVAGKVTFCVDASVLASGSATVTIRPSNATSASTLGGGGGAPSGPAGGALSGTYPNPGLAAALTIPGTLASAQNGAVSASTWTLGGAPFTGGTGTTTVPLYYVNCSGSTQPTTWTTSGTILGMNACNGFAGNLIDLHVNGAATPQFIIHSDGTLTIAATGHGGILTTDEFGDLAINGIFSTYSTRGLVFSLSTEIQSPTNGIVQLTNHSQTSFTRLNLGPGTSSSPALQVNGASLQAELADGSAQTGFSAQNYSNNGVLSISSTAPTVSSGFGTGASVTANNGTSAFRINVGTSNTGNGVIGLPTAATGWNCYATDITTKSTVVDVTLQTASTTATATLQNYSDVVGTHTWVDSDVLAVSCFAY